MKNQQRKQKAIQEAWVKLLNPDTFELLTLNDEGYSNWHCRRHIKNVLWDELYSKLGPVKGKRRDTGNDMLYRPKSLSGIDTNNGWTRIEPDGSNLPAEGAKYIWTDMTGRNIEREYDKKWDAKTWANVYTHYRPVTELPKPIY